eukprot:SAG31_NODE_3896_length_3772_cov_12.045467_2_plen_61_part_00
MRWIDRTMIAYPGKSSAKLKTFLARRTVLASTFCRSAAFDLTHAFVGRLWLYKGPGDRDF